MVNAEQRIADLERRLDEIERAGPEGGRAYVAELDRIIADFDKRAVELVSGGLLRTARMGRQTAAWLPGGAWLRPVRWPTT